MTANLFKKYYIYLPAKIISGIVNSYFGLVRKRGSDHTVSILKPDTTLNKDYFISKNDDVFKWKTLTIKK